MRSKEFTQTSARHSYNQSRNGNVEKEAQDQPKIPKSIIQAVRFRLSSVTYNLSCSLPVSFFCLAPNSVEDVTADAFISQFKALLPSVQELPRNGEFLKTTGVVAILSESETPPPHDTAIEEMLKDLVQDQIHSQRGRDVKYLSPVVNSDTTGLQQVPRRAQFLFGLGPPRFSHAVPQQPASCAGDMSLKPSSLRSGFRRQGKSKLAKRRLLPRSWCLKKSLVLVRCFSLRKKSHTFRPSLAVVQGRTF